MQPFLQTIRSLPEYKRRLYMRMILIITAVVIFFLIGIAITTGIDNASKPAPKIVDHNAPPTTPDMTQSREGLFASMGGLKKFFINEEVVTREQNGFSNLGAFMKELGADITQGGEKIVTYIIEHWFTKTITN